MMRLVIGMTLLFGGLAASPVVAVPITYSFFGIASGSLAGVAFQDTNVAFSLTTDTNTVFNPFVRRPNIFATGNAPIEFVVGTTAGSFVGGGNVFVSGGRGARSAIGLNPATGSDLFDISDASLQAYDLRSAFGPLAAAFPSFLNFGEVFATTAGAFVLAEDDDTRFGFRADLGSSGVVPEPGSWALMIGGFALVGIARRRTRRVQVA